MRIVRTRIVPFVIPFREPLQAGRVVLRERRGCLVELCDETGRTGVGEAAPLPGANGGEVGELEKDLRRACHALLNETAEFEVFLRSSKRARHSATRAAVEMALYDLEAISRGVRVADLLGKARRAEVPVNALLGAPALKSAAAAKRSGFTCLKLKIDGRDMQESCATLREVRDVVGDTMKMRVDLNGGWSVDEAIYWIPRLAAYGVEYIEQPVRSIAELARVRSAVSVSIAADECVSGEAAVRTIAAAGAADVIVVKPALVGLTEAMAIVSAAAECGLDVVVTSTLDTSVGIAAALHLAATLPEPIRHCGLGTAALLAGDLTGDPLLPMRGSLSLPAGPGLGVGISRDEIERWRVGTLQAAVAF